MYNIYILSNYKLSVIYNWTSNNIYKLGIFQKIKIIKNEIPINNLYMDSYKIQSILKQNMRFGTMLKVYKQLKKGYSDE